LSDGSKENGHRGRETFIVTTFHHRCRIVAMGKYVLLLVLGGAGIYALAQQQTNLQTAEQRSERAKEVLARQAARTGFNAIRAETRTVGQEKCADEVVATVGSMSGTYKTDGLNHGTYQAQVTEVSGVDFGYQIQATGQYDGATVTVDQLIRTSGSRAGIVYGTAGNGKLKQTTKEGSEEYGTAPQIRGMGPLATDLDGAGKRELPYVRKSNQKIEMIDVDAQNQGDTQELVPSNAKEGAPADNKTRLSTGMWKSGQPSVFYADDDHAAIYRTWYSGGGKSGGKGKGKSGSSSNIEKVRSPGNGAQAVLGIDDIDGDHEAELVFADASQHIRYIEGPGEAIRELADGGSGSSSGIGAGGLVDLDGDGTASAIFIDGTNNLRIVNADGTDRTVALDQGSDDGAAKTPPTAIDLDSDDELEIAYVRNESDGPDVEYVDADGSDIRPLCGISVEKGAGLQSVEENNSNMNANEWCADSNVGENENEAENENENDSGKYNYDYEYNYTYKKGAYRYEYDYDYVWSAEANQNPSPSPNPPTGKTCGASNLTPNPTPQPDPNP
jgi:hypothetical protein